MELAKITRNLGRSVLGKLRSQFVFKVCRFYVNTFNNDMDCYFYTNGEYNLAKSLLPQCEIVFDIGAATGEWSKVALDISQGRVKIHAFEASKERCNLLSAANNLPIKVNHFALGKEKSTATLYYDTVGGSNSLHPSVGERCLKKQETVPVISLDEYCQANSIPHIDYIKIDVEGNELDVLKGASNMIKNHKIKYIQFEYGPNYIDANCLLKDVFEFIKATNPDYQFYKVMQNRVKKVAEYDYPYENFYNSTWLLSTEELG